MDTRSTKRSSAPSRQAGAPGKADAEQLSNKKRAIDNTIKKSLKRNEKLEQVKDLGSLKEAKHVNFSMEGVMYRDKKTGTMWYVSEGRWKCAVCSDSRYLCRGCGGMSSKYPQLFGCCSMQVFCPNCVSLHGPQDDFCVVGNCDVLDMHVDYWDGHGLYKMDDASIVYFKPMTSECFLIVKK